MTLRFRLFAGGAIRGSWRERCYIDLQTYRSLMASRVRLVVGIISVPGKEVLLGMLSAICPSLQWNTK